MVWGPERDPSRAIREQPAWDEHAAFMDALVDDGFVVLGGPLDDGRDVLLIVEAPDEAAIRDRLAADPWATMGLLRIGSIRSWSIWLDGRARASQR